MNYKRILILALIIANSFAVFTGDSLGLSTTPDGIFISWMNIFGVAQREYDSFNIYRSSDSGEYVRVNALPISPVRSVAGLEDIIGKEGVEFISEISAYTHDEIIAGFQGFDEGLIGLFVLEPMILSAAGLAYLDLDIADGQTYQYQLKGLSDGIETAVLARNTVTHGDIRYDIKPPDTFAIEPSDGSVQILWRHDAEDNYAFKYQIYRRLGASGKFKPLLEYPRAALQMTSEDTIGWASYRDNDVVNGQTYYYFIAPMDIFDNYGESSPIFYGIPRDDTPPRIPQKLHSESSLNGITLLWEPVLDTDVLGYLLYRADEHAGEYKLISDAPISPDLTAWEDRNVEPAREYYYKIRAMDKSGNLSPFSAPTWGIFKNYRPPVPPLNVTATAQTGGVLIEWMPNSEPDIAGYYVFRATSIMDTAYQISKRILDNTSYLDTSQTVHPDLNYWYFVKAVNTSDIFSEFSQPAVGTRIYTIAPQTPLGIRGYKDINGVRLFWHAPDDNTITGWHLFKRVNGVGEFTKFSERPIPANITSMVDTAVEMDQQIEYYLVSVDNNGLVSSPTPTITVETGKSLLSEVRGIWVLKDKGNIVVNWDRSFEDGVAGYNVYRRTSNTDYEKLNRTVLSADINKFVDSSPMQGMRTFYSVRAVNKTGSEGKKGEEVHILP